MQQNVTELPNSVSCLTCISGIKLQNINVLGIKKKNSKSYRVNRKLKLSKIYIGKGVYHEFT